MHRVKFAEHLDKEHNPWHYMYYHMYLQQKLPTELNALERKLLELIKKQSIDYFPLNKAMCLPQSEQDEEVTDKVRASLLYMRINHLHPCYYVSNI
jgi:hypothetical protein